MNAFKAGDLVRITDEHVGHGFEIGETVRLLKPARRDDSWLAAPLDDTDHWWIYPGEFEAIETTPSYLDHPNLAAENAALRSNHATQTQELHHALLDNSRLTDVNAALVRQVRVLEAERDRAAARHGHVLGLIDSVAGAHVGRFGAYAALAEVRRIVEGA